ncbi:STAS domain-containing protein [Myxacorys almedinensis]|uniref:Anti-sigma factor antagonist n=1 Tax=Myxacorys almedinensis A TaxID=2690445 RepID=A0A8J7YZN7_9CYAN|nr:STAS domain-containing protein [Myxacorys almedinensis]NDJ17019.1 anti-sigma factor antagonist [Myxacorys almedinensis A]
MQNVLIRPQTAVVRPCGCLNATNATEFQAQLTAAILSEQHSAVLVDLSQAEALDSAGLMVLVSSLRLAQRRNKRLSLCSVSASIHIIFELTQLDRVFEIFENFAAFQAISIGRNSIGTAA